MSHEQTHVSTRAIGANCPSFTFSLLLFGLSLSVHCDRFIESRTIQVEQWQSIPIAHLFAAQLLTVVAELVRLPITVPSLFGGFTVDVRSNRFAVFHYEIGFCCLTLVQCR
jgi:hypothetical protein